MLQFYAERYISLSRAIVHLRTAIKFPSHTFQPDEIIQHMATDFPTDERVSARKALEVIKQYCVDIGLESAVDQVDRIVMKTSSNKFTHDDADRSLEELENRISDDLKRKYFLLLSSVEAELFTNPTKSLGAIVNKIPNITTDMEEASKCLAVGRSTATVFHLMRAMEVGVQSFGSKLNVQLVGEKYWQVILDQVNKAIKAMPENTPQEKEIRSLYAQTTAHLFNVKVAWRNEVMHPKASYTLEEAEGIFNHVKTFMHHLATEIL